MQIDAAKWLTGRSAARRRVSSLANQPAMKFQLANIRVAKSRVRNSLVPACMSTAQNSFRAERGHWVHPCCAADWDNQRDSSATDEDHDSRAEHGGVEW